MRSYLRWPAVAVFVVLTTSCSDKDGTPTTPTNPDGNAVHYTVLGASDGVGVGGSVVCAPFDTACENGTGYAQIIRRRLQADGKSVTYLNLSVPGSVLSPNIAQLARQFRGDSPQNFLERYPQFVPPTTTVITLFTGGNDANIIGTAVAAGAGGADARGYISAQVQQWAADLADFVGRVRNSAPNARIVAYNLPNLGGAPYLAGRSPQERSIMQRIATGLTDQINGLTSRGVIVIDLMCDARVLQPSSLSSDGFHPSDAGYALMAELALPAILTGAATAPQSSCGQRTLLPVF